MLDEQDITRLREIFKPTDNCRNDMDILEEKVNRNNIRLAVIENQLKPIFWLLCVIGSGVVAIVVKLFCGS